mmetsp:Transcript_70707/g.188737  ORF Transcript_70707/g.188737 Transcript_70707/m.188737 type:complete len:841 (-) Transcript_70707:766-3288(-)
MFTLYNAALRGFPLDAVECLRDTGTASGGINKYETTIFAISSGITKLSKVTAIPLDRKLYRGLGGMVLPDQFWRTFSECQVTIKISAPPTKGGQHNNADLEKSATEHSKEADKVLEGAKSILENSLKTKKQKILFSKEMDVEYLEISGSDPAWMYEAPILSKPKREPTYITFRLSIPMTSGDFNKDHQDMLISAVENKVASDLKVTIENISQKPADFRGGVEFGLMSTTTSKETAFTYSGTDKKRGTIFEVYAGRVDIGASIKFLSQYPGEDEFLMQPLSCLEVFGDLRVEYFKDCEVLVVPLRVNVNLKGVTVEELKERRKGLHLAMVKNLREELSNDAQDRIYALTQFFEKEKESSGTAHPLEQNAIRMVSELVIQITQEFNAYVSKHEETDAADFNKDVNYKQFISSAIEGKLFALTKLKIFAETVQEKKEGHLHLEGNEVLKRIKDQDLHGFGKAGVESELKTGVRGFPWADMENKQHILKLGEWGWLAERAGAVAQNATGSGVQPMGKWDATQRNKVKETLFKNDKLSEICADEGRKLRFENNWNAREIAWEGDIVSQFPGAIGLVLSGCTQLNKLVLKSPKLDLPSWKAIMSGALEGVSTLTSLNGLDFYGEVRAGTRERIELHARGRDVVLPVALLMGRCAGVLTTLNLRGSKDNRLGKEEADFLAKELACLTALTDLDLRDNEFSDPGWMNIAAEFHKLGALAKLNGCKEYEAVRRGGLDKVQLSGVGRDLVLAMAPLLPRSASTLKNLDLSKNLVGPSAVQYIAPHLVGLSKLVTLNLICNGLGGKVRDVYTSIVGIRTLQDVHLSGNGVGPDEKLQIVLAAEARHIKFWC